MLATTVLTEKLREPAGAAELQAAWAGHRPALVVYVQPTHARDLLARPVETLDQLTELFWDERQAFILTPLFRWMFGNTLSRRVDRLLGPR